MQRSSRCACLVLALAAVVAVVWALIPSSRPVQAEAKAAAPDPAALERTRTTVRMLDDLYKGFVVNITAAYVDAQDLTPAAKVTQKVFKHMEAQGWHKARLVDATGKPVNKGNLPQDDFERKAIAQIKGGKSYFDEVVYREGKPHLRAATVVPVVMKQCIICHPGKKQGDLLGAIVYDIPVR